MALFARGEAEWRLHYLVNCGAKKHPTNQSLQFYLLCLSSIFAYLSFFSPQQKVSLSFVAILVPLTGPTPDFKRPTQMADFFPLSILLGTLPPSCHSQYFLCIKLVVVTFIYRLAPPPPPPIAPFCTNFDLSSEPIWNQKQKKKTI